MYMHAYIEKTLETDSTAGLQYNEAAASHTWDVLRHTLATVSGFPPK